MAAFLRPGKALLNRLSYPSKFLIVSLLLIIPLILAIVLLLSETSPRLAFTQSELAGLRYLRSMRNLLEHIVVDQQLARGASGAGGGRAESRARIEADLAELTRIDREVGALLKTTASLAEVKQAWQALRDTSGGAEASEAQYESLIAAIHQLIAEVGDRSNLILDPELTSYYLMDAVLLKLPEQTVLLGRATVQAERLSQGGTADAGDLVVTLGLLRENTRSVQQGLGVAFATTPATRPRIEAALTRLQETSESFAQLLEQTAGRVTPTSAEVLREGAAATHAANAWLSERSGQELEGLLQRRLQLLHQKNGLAGGVALALLLVVLYLLASFYRSVMDLVGALDQAARAMVEGDVGAKVAIETRDELGAVVRSFDIVATALVTAAAERHAAEAERVRMQEQVIQSQRALLDELAAPLIPITDDIVVLPLIGTMDAGRVSHLLDSLTRGVVARRASIVIVDITGVPSVGADVAQGLVQAAQAARLLGARFLLTGIRSTVAYTLATLDADFRGIATYSTLSSGVAEALAQQRRQPEAAR